MGKILIADKDPIVIHSIQVAFKRFGHTFVIARDSDSALKRLRREHFDLALIEDFTSLEKGSSETLSNYCRLPEKAQTPVILMLGSDATLDTIQKAKETGAADFILKPFHPRELVNKAMAVLKQKVRVACLGGGTGLYMLLMGLKVLPQTHLTSIVSMSDDGGSTGRLREAFGILPPGDVRRSLVALSTAPQLMNQMLTYRFPKQSHLVGHNLGNLILTALSQICGSMQEAVRAAGDILNINGVVIPVTNTQNKLVATLETGEVVIGENTIDVPEARDFKLKIVRLEQRPQVEANPEALFALQNSEFIIIGPGDLYTSIVSNLIVKGVPEAVHFSKAKKIYIANLMTKPGETYGMSVEDHVEEIVKYLGGDCLDYVIASKSVIPRQELKRYAAKDQAPVTIKDHQHLKRLTAAKIIEADLASIHDYIRHDSYKLAKTLCDLLPINCHKGFS